MIQTATVPAVREEELRFGIGRGWVESRAETAAVVAPRFGLVIEEPLFLHESNSTVVWLRHMRWWRRWQLAIPIVWASGYKRAKARHLMLRQNWKYCLLNSQPRPVTRTVNNRSEIVRAKDNVSAYSGA
jgi:hypothetical protein